MSFVVPTWCGDEIHNLVLTRDGRMASFGDKHDFALEITFADLGAALPHCAWHYQRWLDNPLAWVQGPLFGAWRHDAELDVAAFSGPLDINWQEQNLKFLAGLLLLDASDHAVKQLEGSYNRYDTYRITQPIKHGRKSYSDSGSYRDTYVAMARLQEMVLDEKAKGPNFSDADIAIMWFVKDSAGWAYDGWFYDHDLRRLNDLYRTYLQLGDPEEMDLWLRRRIAHVLESLIEEQRWPSMS